MGSIPITRSNRNAEERVLEFEEKAHVAQSVEHVLGKDEVTGSIPVVGSRQVGLGNRGLGDRQGVRG